MGASSHVGAADAEDARAKLLGKRLEAEGFKLTSSRVRPGMIQLAAAKSAHHVKLKVQSFMTLPNNTSGIGGLLKQANAEEPRAARRTVKLAGAEAARLSVGAAGDVRETTLLFVTKDRAATLVWRGNPTQKEFRRLAASLSGALGGSGSGGVSGRLGKSLAGIGSGASNSSRESQAEKPTIATVGGATVGGGASALGASADLAPRAQATGSGFYVSKDLILTSGLVAPDATRVRLTDSAKGTFAGEVVARAKTSDGLSLTLIKTARAGVAIPLARTIADQAVFALGSGLKGLEAKGQVQGADEGALVTSATLVDRHLGGPLVDGEGRAIGLLFARPAKEGSGAQGCAVPSAELQAFLAKQGVKLSLARPTPATERLGGKRILDSIVRVEASR